MHRVLEAPSCFELDHQTCTRQTALALDFMLSKVLKERENNASERLNVISPVHSGRFTIRGFKKVQKPLLLPTSA